MSRKLPARPVELNVGKLVHGGQALARDDAGKTVFVWNALPGERVSARIIKRKRSYDEAIAETIITASPERETPREANYLATSPWQIMSYDAENSAKRTIVAELFTQAGVTLPPFDLTVPDQPWAYRNKMEYSFWGDDEGLHLALHRRGSHGKQIVTGSALALPPLDAAANAVLETLRVRGTRAGDLKTLIVRATEEGQTAAALFVKDETFPALLLPEAVQGMRIYYSDPKSPASVGTALLHEAGDCRLHDRLLGKPFVYDVDSFFQVNLPVFERALERIREHCEGDPVDLYAGVGGIGLSIAHEHVTLVELDPASAAMARLNAAASDLQAEVVEASTEKVLEHIDGNRPIIVDPPRAGLHRKVIERLHQVTPPQLIYLSCNPATQARDLALLAEVYRIDFFETYNFFPRTPHIETLAILLKK